MLKILRNIKSTIQLGESGVNLVGNNKIGCNGKYELDKIEIGNSEVNSGEVRDNEFGKKRSKNV